MFTGILNKGSKLAGVAEKIAKCRVCKRGKTGIAVPGEGNPSASIMFIGEAPGRKESETGRPFVGRSGQLLRRLIKKTGLKEKDVFITSPVKYLPKKGTPSSLDIEHGRKHLFEQIRIIEPKILVLLGNTACKAILTNKIQVMKEHGKIIGKGGIKYLVTIHPAAVLRFPKYTSIIKSDFKKLKALFNLPLGKPKG